MIEPGDILDHYIQIGNELFGFEVLAIDPEPNLTGSYGYSLSMECPNCSGDNTCVLPYSYRPNLSNRLPDGTPTLAHLLPVGHF